jgi:hypothetical protein
MFIKALRIVKSSFAAEQIQKSLGKKTSKHRRRIIKEETGKDEISKLSGP